MFDGKDSGGETFSMKNLHPDVWLILLLFFFENCTEYQHKNDNADTKHQYNFGCDQFGGVHGIYMGTKVLF